MIIYLYVKTHNKTGLKYLGKTHALDPYKYPGSGIYWTKHLKKHGNDVSTEILKECRTNEELRYWGLYYSTLWNIVDARNEFGRKIWANLRPEEGKGGWGGKHNPTYSHENIERARAFMLSDKNPAKDPVIAEKIREQTKIAMNKPEVRERYLIGINSDKWRNARKARTGCKAPNYDSTIFSFIHESGIIEHCTKHQLREKYGKHIQSHRIVNRERKQSGGWRLL